MVPSDRGACCLTILRKLVQAKAKNKPNVMKRKAAGVAAAEGADDLPPEAPKESVKKKNKRFVEDKKDVLAFVESVGGTFACEHVLASRRMYVSCERACAVKRVGGRERACEDLARVRLEAFEEVSCATTDRLM
jgi:hypothetical protein